MSDFKKRTEHHAQYVFKYDEDKDGKTIEKQFILSISQTNVDEPVLHCSDFVMRIGSRKRFMDFIEEAVADFTSGSKT